MPKRLNLTDEEREERKRQYQAKYRAKQKAKKQALKSDAEKQKASLTKNQDPATEAALINEKYGFSEVFAFHSNRNRIVIAEKMLSASVMVEGDGNGQFRVKETRYHNFSSRKEAIEWMKSNGCRGLKEF